MYRAPNWHDYRGISADPALLADFNDIVDRLRKGEKLPARYYRSGIDRDHDKLLSDMGVKHLHLGNQGSDTLLYAVEFPDRIELLQINGHIHLQTRPRGKLLEGLFGAHLRKLEAVAIAATVATAATATALVGTRRRRRRGKKPPSEK